MENKWGEFNSSDYHIENLGRPAVFHLPVRKLTKELKEGLEQFLVANVGAYTFEGVPNFGAWINGRQIITKDECVKYEVSFVGKEKLRLLIEKLVEIAKEIGEECIYIKAGQYAGLIFPHPRNS